VLTETNKTTIIPIDCETRANIFTTSTSSSSFYNGASLQQLLQQQRALPLPELNLDQLRSIRYGMPPTRFVVNHSFPISHRYVRKQRAERLALQEKGATRLDNIRGSS
jgi:hypothetical protein